MAEAIKWQVSVRELSEFGWRAGDLKVGFSGSTVSMQRGAEGHRWFQKKQGKSYEAEVTLSRKVVSDDVVLNVSGRADGIYTDTSPLVVEELKTTTDSLMLLFKDSRPTHWAQARLYGALLAKEKGLNEVIVRLTYIQLETLETRSFEERFDADDIEQMFCETTTKYLEWLTKVFAWRQKRDASLGGLPFPFDAYRSGQKELAGAMAQTINSGKSLFVEAPTGAGKTMAVLYGALGSLERKEVSQVVFATAKTVGRLSADKALDQLSDSGALLKRVNLGAKHRVCVHPGKQCTTECELVKGHYDKLPAARDTVISPEFNHPEAISKAAEEHKICPYWLAREMVPWVDVVVCDYNYLFDPRVSLHAFSSRGPRALLVDEAHNLVDRAREMYGATMRMGAVQKLLDELKPQHESLKKRLVTLRTQMKETAKTARKTDGPWPIMNMPPKKLMEAIDRFAELAGAWLADNRKTTWRQLLEDIFFECHAFMRAANRLNSSDILLADGSGRLSKIKIMCLDPSQRLREKTEAMGASAVYFSATLSPIEYFRRTLGGSEQDPVLKLPSPFPKDNLKTVIANYISTRFKDRSGTGKLVAETILATARSHEGNYLVFFPSYNYLNDVAQYLPETSSKLEIAIQTQGFSEEQKKDFLGGFEKREQGSLLGLAVLGGLFGEGIDLVGERLEGVIVVSPGLPKMCVERELIRNHFERSGESGFKNAYLYPGMNRVVQAGGRLIRSETDCGVIILVGDRFASQDYATLLPEHWAAPVQVSTPVALEEQLLRFWSLA